MPDVVLQIGPHRFEAKFESADAPRTCAAFRGLLPFTSQVIHVRWSGEAVWAPLGDLSIGVPPENATSYPHPGEVLWYPGGISECEIFFPYGACTTSSKVGQLAANHFATLEPDEGWQDRLREVGRRALWEGAQPIRIAEVD